VSAVENSADWSLNARSRPDLSKFAQPGWQGGEPLSGTWSQARAVCWTIA
jgi:hypothetical protein